MTRTGVLVGALAFLTASGAVSAPAQDQTQGPGKSRAPNLVILLADDLGYGDLGCYGHPTIRTPNLDRMAAEGLKLTQFYGMAVCTPSRAALLTGRLPVRSGLNRVLFPTSQGGIPASEVTLARALKARGYATMCIGKWHLGHLPEYLPTRHGFDHYFGIPYSNDMNVKASRHPPIPLMRDEAIVEQPAVQETLTQRYTQEALQFIRGRAAGAKQGNPFFLYLPFAFPHIPLYASKAFRGKSPRGSYGDVVEEIDWSVGQVLAALRDLGLAESTLVIFTSDNGPWLIQRSEGGSAGLFRDGKGSTWEGGVRVPCLAWWPGTIAPGRVVRDLATHMDLFATALELAGGKLPDSRPLDGVSLVPVLRGTGPSPRRHVFYYLDTELSAVRRGPWKLHVMTVDPVGDERRVVARDPPLLFHLDIDPSEQFDVAARHPHRVRQILRVIEAHRRSIKAGEPQF